MNLPFYQVQNCFLSSKKYSLMKQVIKWIAGIGFLTTSFGVLVDLNYFSFLLFLIAGLFCLPPSMTWIESKFFNKNLRSFYKYIIVIAAWILGGLTHNSFSNSNSEKTIDNDNNSVTTSAVDSILNIRKHEKITLINNFDSLAKANLLKIDKDEFKPDVAFYQPINAPKFRNVNWMYPYLGKSDNQIYLRYVIQYEADDWLFIESVKVKVTFKDGNERIIDLYSGNFERDNKGGRIWEWIDINVSDEMYIKLLDIYNAKSAKIRFEGQQYYKERNMTVKELKALINVINVYKLVRD